MPQVETVDVAENQGEGAEEEVENAEEDGGEEAQVEDHELKNEQLEGPKEREADSPGNGLLVLFHGGFPAVVTSFLSPRPGHVTENDGVCGR